MAATKNAPRHYFVMVLYSFSVFFGGVVWGASDGQGPEPPSDWGFDFADEAVGGEGLPDTGG